MSEILSTVSLSSGLLALGLGFFVFLKDIRKRLNLLFLLYCVSISIWLIATSFMLRNTDPEEINFWDRLIYSGIVFIPIFVYHFGMIFANKEKENRGLIYLGYFLAFIFLILSRTDYFISGVYFYNWGVHTKAKFFHHLFLIFFASYIFLFFKEIYHCIGKAKREKDKIKELQAKYLFFSFIGFAIGAYAFLSAYGIGINPLGAYLGGVFAAFLLFFAITKYHLFEIRVILTELLVGLIAILLLINIIGSKTTFEYTWKGGLFLAFLFFGWLLIKSIIGEIKQKEELQLAYQKLEKLDEAKTEFLSIASHQLRTPLTAIKGYISMILEGSYGKIPESIERPMENVFKSNERLIKLVNELLDVSRIESGRVKLSKEKASLEEIISNIVEELKVEAENKGIYLKFAPLDNKHLTGQEKPLPKILIDKDKIRQVILNIVDNAIKYTEKGGVTIKLKMEDEKCRIEISDTGAGITKEEIGGLFQSFKRGIAGNKLWTEGTGLGLYVAKRFVEMHQGKIWAESEGKGKGSTFFIELPTE